MEELLIRDWSNEDLSKTDQSRQPLNPQMIIPADRLEEEKQCAERIKIAAASEEMNI